MSIDPQLTNNVLNSKAATTIAKRLWPTMLFLVVMSLISLFGAQWWTSKLDKINMTIAFWFWFVSITAMVGFGIYAFFLDARIQFAQETSKSKTSSKKTTKAKTNNTKTANPEIDL